MASRTIRKPCVQVIYRPYAVSYPRSALISYEESGKSSSSRRAKPVDLFASSTSVSAFRLKERYDIATGYIKSYNPFSGAYDKVDGHYEYGTYGGGGVETPTIGDLTQQSVDAASVAVRGKVKDQKVNLALSIAEGRKSIDMINSLAQESIYFYMKLRRKGLPSLQWFKKNGTKLPKHHKELADKWLAYQYGVKPIVNDIYGLAEEFSRKCSSVRYTYGRVSDSKSYGYVQKSYDGTSSTKHIIDVQTVIRYRFEETYSGPSTAVRLGLTNVPDLLWQMVPYSFVFDAIYDVGSYLHGMDALVGVRGFLQSTTTRVKTLSVRTSLDSTNRDGAREYSSVSRSAAVPFVPYGSPQWDNKKPSITRLANYVALLSQIRG